MIASERGPTLDCNTYKQQQCGVIDLFFFVPFPSQMETFSKIFVATQYKKEGQCRFKMTDLPTFSKGYYHFLVKKGSPYATKFNKA